MLRNSDSKALILNFLALETAELRLRGARPTVPPLALPAN
jgi:hypothetical protein